MPFFRNKPTCFSAIRLSLCAILLSTSTASQALDTSLPDIGDRGSSSISLDEERRLGEAWLRVLKGQASQLRDPFVDEYTQYLLYQLVQYSSLVDKQLTLVILKNNTLNAFAVPGSIIGVHSGLYLYAETEGQFASVLAHELAHLSQRHYSNNVEEQRKSLPMQLATLFGAILVASATNNSDATAATIASGQAAIVDKQLAYSRQNEREADDIGMELLARAGYDPSAMPNMFSQMLRATRFQGDSVPEFLRTHPVTQSRVADSQNRAAQLKEGGRKNSLQYQLIKTRVSVQAQDDVESLIAQFDAMNSPSTVDHYGHVLAAIAAGRPAKSQESLTTLLDKLPDNLYIQALQVEYQTASKDYGNALNNINRMLSFYPGNPALTQLKINIHREQKQYGEVTKLLNQLIRQQPNNDYLWYQLAENEGLRGELLEVHRARAEFYLLRGNTKRAETHIKQALRLPSLTSQQKAILEDQLKETKAVRDSLDF